MSQFIPSVRDNPHCLICNSRVGVSTRNSVQVFNKQVLTCSERPMDIIISGVVGKILKEDNVQSHLICKKCYKLFMEYDELETRLAEIKSEIVANYKRTLLKYKQNSSIEEESELKEITIKKEPEEDAKDESDTGKKNTNVLAQKKEQTLNEQNVKQSEHPEMGDIEEQLEKMHASAEDMEVDEVVERVEVIQDADECTENVPQISIPETSDADDTSHSFHGFTQTDEPVDAGAIDNSDDSDYQPPLILEVIQNGESNGEKQNGEDNTAALLEAAAMAEQTIQEDGSLVYNVKIEPDIMYDDVKQLMRRKVGVRKLLKPKNDEYLEPIVSRDGALYTCLACDGEEKAIGDGKSMMLHVKTVHDLRVYICDVCGDDFRKRNELSLHLDEHVATEEGDFQCEICNRIFCNLRLFRIHKRMHYPQSKLWTCETCGKRYSSRNLLDEHINTHTGIRPYVCNVCSKDFASKYTFRAHMKTHEVRPRPFSCSQCEKTFLSQQNLTQHERTHTGIKDYVCHLCGKAFGSPHNLEVHSIVHTGYKPFICRTCGKAFARKAEIRDHERTHTGERPYQCEFCGATFSQRSNLQSHKRATHYDDKRYKCRECGKGFKRRRLLDYHMKAVHTGERPFKCNVCDATFVYPEHFKKHRRIHTGEKPFLCEVCGKAFNSRDNRNAHRFVHSDKKPYECLVCGMGFMRKPLLYAHMETQGHLNDTIVVNQPRLTTEDDQVVTFNIEGEMEMVNADPDDQDPDASEDTKVYIAGLKDHVIIQNTDEGTVIVGTAASDGNEIDQDAVEHLIIDGQVHYTTRSEDGGTEVHEISDGDLTREQILNDSGEYEEVITDQLVEENSQMIQTSSGPIHLVQVRLNNSDGEEQDAWVNLVTE